jgi:hypothetical protein
MSDEQDTPVWHAIVGEGWMPVQFGEETRRDDEVLDACGWRPCATWEFAYTRECMPRRRPESSYEILVIKNGVDYCRMRAVKPGDYFMVAENGELVPIEVEE